MGLTLIALYMRKTLHPSVRNVTVDQTPPFTPEETKEFYSKRIIVDGEYILRGQFDEELNVRDFYFNPDQIELLMDLLHSLEHEEGVNELYQELYTQVVYHPDKFYETNQPKVVV